jgi:hypothetical protein
MVNVDVDVGEAGGALTGRQLKLQQIAEKRANPDQIQVGSHG